MLKNLRILGMAIVVGACAVCLKLHAKAPPSNSSGPIMLANAPGAADIFCYICAKFGIVEKSSDIRVHAADLGCVKNAAILVDSLARVGLKARVAPADNIFFGNVVLPAVLVKNSSWLIIDRCNGDGSFDIVEPSGIRKTIAAAQPLAETGSQLVEIQRPDEHEVRPKSLPLIPGMPSLQMGTLLADSGQVNRASREVRFVFPFVNVGSGNLNIRRVTPSCTCVKVQYPKKAIAPNSTGEIVAEYDVSNDKGPFSKFLIVQSDDPRYPELKLGIQGYVADELAVSPLYVNFGRVARSGTAEADVIVRYYAMRECRITETQADWPDIQVNVQPITGPMLAQLFLGEPHAIDPERLHNLLLVSLRIKPGTSSQGIEDGYVTLHTNLPGSKSVVRIAVQREIIADRSGIN